MTGTAGRADGLEHRSIRAGRPWPLGATFDGSGVNFAVFSAHATRVEVCLFTEEGHREVARLALPERDGDIWHGRIEGLTLGSLYGLRVHGPYAPEQGHRFNPNKLLIDPYARQIKGRLRWSDALMGYRVASPAGDLSFDGRDSAFAMPKCVVVDPSFAWGEDRHPETPLQESLIYETHVKGLTMANPAVEAGLRGSFLGLCSDPMIEHLQRLGVTAVELLPVHGFLNDRFLQSRGLTNYWGYQSVAFFAPEPRYLTRGAVWEFQAMVRRLHSAGIEVILDVVYNHTGEGDEFGPTLSLRGIDNKSYYRLIGEGRHYENVTGTGNTLNLGHHMGLRLVMDSLRYWVEVMHVDGFRFDLATALTRGAGGLDPGSAFLDAIRQDPVLSRVKLIAEPWDIGPGGYRLGRFPHPFLEWNDQYRDDLRRFWRGEAHMTARLARRLLGSAEVFDHGGRAATTSVNFLTCHDGFTLQDLVSYRNKHNEANGEEGRDGHNDNHSENFGVEGPSTDPQVLAARDLRKRNLLATLFLSQGVPMLLAGDELGNSQAGNNNAYAQDNPLGWVDWPAEGRGMVDFIARLSALRRRYPVLSQRRFLHARIRAADGLADLEWRRADGAVPLAADWEAPDWRAVGLVVRGAAEAEDGDPGETVFVFFNAGAAAALRLPEGSWQQVLDTSAPDGGGQAQPVRHEVAIAANSVSVFVQAGMA